MRYVLVILVLTVSAGCATRAARPPQRSGAGEYVQGFMDGYVSAHPDLPYAGEHGAGPWPTASGPRRCPYEHGWSAGYAIGSRDVEQAE